MRPQSIITRSKRFLKEFWCLVKTGHKNIEKERLQILGMKIRAGEKSIDIKMIPLVTTCKNCGKIVDITSSLEKDGEFADEEGNSMSMEEAFDHVTD